MSTNRLRYHALAFDLTGTEPRLHQDRLQHLVDWEIAHRVALPAALHEYLALEKWADGSRIDLGKFLEQHRALLKASRGEGRTLELGYNSWGSTVLLLMDGRDDPAVFLSPSHGKLVRSFSRHLFDECWASMTAATAATGQERLWLTAVEPEFGPVGLDFLKDHFAEGDHYTHRGLPLEEVDLLQEERNHLANGEYRFFTTGARLEVISMAHVARGEEGAARWRIVADDAAALFSAAAFVWRWGTLAKSLGTDSPLAAPVLQRLRERYHA